MGRQKHILFPKLQKMLQTLGENIHLARLRRQFSMTLLAERAGISRTTLHAVEAGNPKVTLGAYVSVLFCLGLENDITLIAQDDELGRKLQDAALPLRARAPKSIRSNLKKNDDSKN